MGSRLLAVAHGPTDASYAGRFALPGDELRDAAGVPTLHRRVQRVTRGSEHRCSTTASALDVDASVDSGWDDLDVGSWAGQALTDVEPTEIGRWVHDPAYDGHGGESVEALHARVRDALVAVDSPGLTLVVTSPAVLRALVVIALGAPTAAHRQVSAGPLDAVELSRERGPWNLVRLRPCPQWVHAHDLADDGDGGSA